MQVPNRAVWPGDTARLWRLISNWKPKYGRLGKVALNDRRPKSSDAGRHAGAAHSYQGVPRGPRSVGALLLSMPITRVWFTAS
jgi:hypothetical protein